MQDWMNTPVAIALSWALYHFLWQGVLIAAPLEILLAAFPSGRSRVRYAAALTALTGMATVFLWTFFSILQAPDMSGAPWDMTTPAFVSRYLPLAVPIWMVGVLLFYLRDVAAWFAAKRLCRTGVCQPTFEWESRLRQLAQRMGITKPIPLLESCFVDSPVMIGILHPTILMPVGMLAGLPVWQVEAILLHELAHIRRHDYFVNLFQNAIEGLLFFHPVVWRVSSVLRAERENCCDDIAVEMTGDARAYAATLIHIEQLRAHTPAASLAIGGDSLLPRIRRLLRSKTQSHLRTPASLFVGLCFWLMVFTSTLASWQPASVPELRRQALAVPARQIAQANLPSSTTAGPLTAGAPALGQVTLQGSVLQDHTGSAAASTRVRVRLKGERMLSADLETDSNGRFQAIGLPAGDYTLEFSKPSYVSASMEARLDKAKPVTTLAVRLIPFAVVTGKAVYGMNQPASGAYVYAVPKPERGGVWKLDQIQGRYDSVSAKGEYRIFNLPPGQYGIVVSYGASTAQVGSSGGARTAAALGSGYNFYPNNSNPEIFTVSGGEEFTNIDFLVTPGTRYSVSGTASPLVGNASVWLALARVDQPSVASAVAIARNGGDFKFEGVAPGSYYLFASGPSTGRNTRGALFNPNPIFARTQVEVSGQNVEGVAVTLSGGTSATFELNRDRAVGACPESAEMVLTGMEDWGAFLERRITLSDGKQAVLNDLAPARYMASFPGLDSGCFGEEMEIDLSTARTEPVKLKIAASGSVRGTLTGITNAAAEYTVFLVPITPVAEPDTARVAHSDAQGRFTFGAIKPGRYRITVQPATEPRRVSRPEGSVEISIGGGSPTDIELPVPAKEK